MKKVLYPVLLEPEEHVRLGLCKNVTQVTGAGVNPYLAFHNHQ